MSRRSTDGPDAAETRIHPATDHEPGPRPPTLTVVAPPTAAGRHTLLDPYGTTIGRDPACDFVLPSDLVSRRHAVVRRRGAGYEIEDLGSSNGTRVNGRPITGRRALRSGDHVDLGDVQLTFSYAGAPRTESSYSGAPRTESSYAGAPRGESESLRRELRDAPGFGLRALVLAIAGSIAGTVLPAAFGTGAWATLAGATIGPVVSTVFSTKVTGERGRVRAAAITLLSVAALVITVTGFTLGDKATGGSLLPGTDDRTGTFPDLIENNGGTGATPEASVATVELAAVECGGVAVGTARDCPQTTIRYHGPDRLHVTGVEMRGDAAGDFSAQGDCVDHWLEPDESCALTVTFRPSAEGERTATLVVRQDPAGPGEGGTARVTGTGTAATGGGAEDCLPGFVWRAAVSGDHVCVPPATHDQALADNAAADSRRSPTGGDYGPDTCLPGYVWREVTPADLVCVTPETRGQVQSDNDLASSRRAS
ncbi:hypothetical protein GCM10010168_25400 [Actinoplanes ianthinogenes]|uniref:FHA domain-containing protein n=1 Tax=Actinoplanes ianthinogenes TaxID=122358 RepID=A0ABN6CSG3_9ACTN|nr:FHA domain-containing protein [Actinoplanes ianthinogenes]BCJ48180.1 hypothetical protein Aiant_88370 [Actinoplanes ianthinogenes]GGR06993.1 hypothetical protein GCM10010168_25400 [Actinoplanes ianthinogenes]